MIAGKKRAVQNRELRQASSNRPPVFVCPYDPSCSATAATAEGAAASRPLSRRSNLRNLRLHRDRRPGARVLSLASPFDSTSSAPAVTFGAPAASSAIAAAVEVMTAAEVDVVVGAAAAGGAGARAAAGATP